MANIFGNVIDRDELKASLTKAFNELDRILIEHSGPFATSSVIGSKWRQSNDVDEFTKDGIKILRHLIVSEEPCARLAARMARFVGIAVDARCHDGTTTSMLLFCRLAIGAIDKMDDAFLSASRYTWSKALYNTLSTCLEILETIRITEDDLLERCQSFGIDTSIEEVRAAMAYHMSMISSKGDDDLSSKVATLIGSCPKKIYGMFKDTPSAVETQERYILKKQDHDIAVRGNLGNVQDYNHRSDTQFLSENAVIFATGNDIIINSMESLFLTSFISTRANIRANLVDFGETQGWEAYHEGKKNLIIMAPMIDDPGLITEINIFNAQNPQCRISWMIVQVQGRMRTSLNKTLHYMAGVPLFQDVLMVNPVSSLIGLQETDVRVHLMGSTITMSHLYEKDGHVYHPLFREDDLFPPYTEFARETEELIEFAKENLTNPALNQEELVYLTSLYRCLTTQDIYDIEIGGSIHEQYANRTVYEDAIGAALSAVNEGVVLGGYAQLATYFSATNYSDDGTMTLLAETFTTIVEDSLRVNHGDPHLAALLDYINADKWSFVVANTMTYHKSQSPSDYIQRHYMDKEGLKFFLTCSPERTYLLQAYGGYNEQFRRSRDMLPQLANTTHLADMRVDPNADVN